MDARATTFPPEGLLMAALSDPGGPDAPTGSDALDALALRARTGDTEAFESLMSATEARVLSVAWRMLGDRDRARDAAQDVYLRVFRSLRGYRPGGDFRGWIYRITVNVCRDHERRSRLFRWFLPLSRRDRPGPQEIPVRVEERVEERLLVEHALKALPPRERAALVLRDLEGLTAEEAAAVLGSSAGTVRSQVASARQKLRLLLGPERRGGAR